MPIQCLKHTHVEKSSLTVYAKCIVEILRFSLEITPYFFFQYFLPSPEDIFSSLLLEREDGRERNIDARKKHRSVASHRRLGRGLNPKPRDVP